MSGFYDLPFFPIGPNEGTNGKDGVSPTISIEDITGGHRLIIVDAAGRKTVDVLNGTEGPQGIQGEPGPTGAQGPKGDTGNQGPIGLTGPQGPKGDTGEQGPKGDTGPIGPEGPRGETGEQGLPGKDGTNGINGKSAYEYAQDGGYSGTETNFIALLANTVSTQSISLGLHTDGLLYIFIDGEPVGTGINIATTTES